MPNRNYQRGRRYEWRVCQLLSRVGYECTRSAGSHGLWDVIAVGANDVRLIQVKCGKSPFSELDRETFKELPAPQDVTKELWRFPAPRRQPIIEVL